MTFTISNYDNGLHRRSIRRYGMGYYTLGTGMGGNGCAEALLLGY